MKTPVLVEMSVESVHVYQSTIQPIILVVVPRATSAEVGGKIRHVSRVGTTPPLTPFLPVFFHPENRLTKSTS